MSALLRLANSLARQTREWGDIEETGGYATRIDPVEVLVSRAAQVGFAPPEAGDSMTAGFGVLVRTPMGTTSYRVLITETIVGDR